MKTQMKQKITIIILFAIIGLSRAIAQIPTNGLVGYYPFTGNANDQSGNNLNGVVNGATLTSDRFGNANSAYLFNNNYIQISNSGNVNFTNGITFCAWIYTSQYHMGGIIDKMDFTSGFRISTRNSIAESIYNSKIWAQINGYYLTDTAISTTQYTLNSWQLIVGSYNPTDDSLKLYNNGTLVGKALINQSISNTNNIVIGRSTPSGIEYFKGVLDDIRIYNRALSQSEVTLLYQENMCSDTTINDTTTYFVSSPSFQALSPKSYFVNTENLTTNIGGCDSIINHYLKYVYNPTYCSVTDTLIIDVTLTGIPNPNNKNTLKVYPNPAKDYVIINTGNYSSMSNYTLEIENSLGQTVFTTTVNQAQFEVNVNTIGGLGLYFIKVIDNNSSVLEIRKLILQ